MVRNDILGLVSGIHIDFGLLQLIPRLVLLLKMLLIKLYKNRKRNSRFDVCTLSVKPCSNLIKDFGDGSDQILYSNKKLAYSLHGFKEYLVSS